MYKNILRKVKKVQGLVRMFIVKLKYKRIIKSIYVIQK